MKLSVEFLVLFTAPLIASAALPTVTLNSPSDQTITQNTTLTISADATDPDGDMTEHNLDVQRPDGQWNWEGGWSTQWPFQGGVNGSGYSSSKSAQFTFDQAGVWHVRSAAYDGTGWAYSSTAEITVNPSGNQPPTVTLSSPTNQTITVGTTLTIAAQATDPDGNMTEHNLDIQRPDGQWNWEGGWSTQWPFQGGVNGSGFSSSKSTSFTFNQAGVWHIRSAAYDGTGWYYSDTVEITVTANYGYISTMATINLTDGGAPNATGAHYSINDNGVVVSGATTYVQNQPPDTTTTFTLHHAAAGPGYVVWTVWESHGTLSGYTYTIVRNMLARYIRATQSWTVSEVVEYTHGGVYTGYYSFADIVPGSLTAQQYEWAAQLQTWRIGGNGGDAWMEYGTFAIPTQQL